MASTADVVAAAQAPSQPSLKPLATTAGAPSAKVSAASAHPSTQASAQPPTQESAKPLVQPSAQSATQPSAEPLAQPLTSLFSKSSSAPTTCEPLLATAGSTSPNQGAPVQSTSSAAVPLHVLTASQFLPSYHAEALLDAQHTPATNKHSQAFKPAGTSATHASLTGTVLPSACNSAAPTLPRVRDHSPPCTHSCSVPAAEVLEVEPLCSTLVHSTPTQALPYPSAPANAPATAAAGSPDPCSTSPAAMASFNLSDDALRRDGTQQAPRIASAGPSGPRSGTNLSQSSLTGTATMMATGQHSAALLLPMLPLA